jgi:antitoxin component of MazEF toxin-antitoxin module
MMQEECDKNPAIADWAGTTAEPDEATFMYYTKYNFIVSTMAALQAVVKRIGNSLGVLIPKEVVERTGIREGDSVEIQLTRKVNLREMFGAVKFSKSSQELKDEMRGGWGD